MWPYEEYTVLENILIIVIPYLLALILYIFLKPLVIRKAAERQARMESR